MGGASSVEKPFRLPPNAELIEIRNKDLYGPMAFTDGLYATIPVQLTHQIIAAFDIEKKRHIKRVRRLNSEFNDIIMSYTCDDRVRIETQLKEMGVDAELHVCKFPRWCPYSEQQKQECNAFWPMNDVLAAPELDIDPIMFHERWIVKSMTEQCIIIRSSDPKDTKIIAVDGPCDCENCDGHINHSVIRALRAASQAVRESDSGYLCTGLDVYCYREPCIMCAMAMTHSRVGRLFYVEPNHKYGGIESQAQVHSNPCLNHRYRAFRLNLL